MILDDVLRQHAYKTGTFRLASGAVASEYLDLKTAALHPQARLILGRYLARVLPGCRAVAGVAVGGALLAHDVARMLNLPCLVVRAELKDHGMGKLVAGLDNLGDQPTDVALIEDVLTTGASALRALEILTGLPRVTVTGLIAVVDREQGGLLAVQRVYPDMRVQALTTLSAVRATQA